MEDFKPKSAPRLLGDAKAVQRSLNICRTTLEKQLRDDPTFPMPWMARNKRQWFMDEIEDYKQAQPRRIYAAVVAVLAVASVVAPFLANSLSA